MGAPLSTSYQTDKRPIRIEIFYFDGCPSYHEASENVNTALRELGVQAEVHLIAVTTNEEAAASKFLGSPSVRVEGVDVEMSHDPQADYSLRCRRYAFEGSVQGFPSTSILRLAIEKALESHE